MSAKPTKARGESEPEIHSLEPLHDDYRYNGEDESLTKAEKRRLNFLGYKRDDIAELSSADARRLIEAKVRKVGSKAFLKSAINPLTGTPGSPLPAAFSNEEIQRRNANKENPHIIRDEWEGKRQEAGGNLFDNMDRPYREANPDKVFRWLHPDCVDGSHPMGDGGFVPVAGPSASHRVEVGGHYLAWKPRDVQEDEDREQAELNNAPFRQITDESEELRAVQNADMDDLKQLSRFHDVTIARGNEMPRHIG